MNTLLRHCCHSAAAPAGHPHHSLSRCLLCPVAHRLAEGGGDGDDEAHPHEEEEEEEQAFSPERGNVVFGSAYDGWAFRINQFAEMYAGGVQDAKALCSRMSGCLPAFWPLERLPCRCCQSHACGCHVRVAT